MPSIGLPDLFGVRRQFDRYTRSQHLRPLHAETDQARRNRRNHSSHDKERRRPSLDRGYRSDNDSSRRRDGRSGERHHAEPSHRSHRKDVEDRRIPYYYEREEEMRKHAPSAYTPERRAAQRERKRLVQISKPTENGNRNSKHAERVNSQELVRKHERSRSMDYAGHARGTTLGDMFFEPPKPMKHVVAIESSLPSRRGQLRRVRSDHFSHDGDIERGGDGAVPTRSRGDDRPISTVTMPLRALLPTSGSMNPAILLQESIPSTLNGSHASVDWPSDAQLPRILVPQSPTDSLSASPPLGQESFRTATESYRQETGSLLASRYSLPSPVSSQRSSLIAAPSYQYLPLEESEFRLIRVLPERMSTVKCEIFHQSFDDTVKYIAISYAWGDSVEKKLLVLEGALVPVATSLYDALESVRQKDKEVLVWIDALSIDQQNGIERAEQVRLMGQIYSQAESVAICLGPEADDSASAIKLLEKVANKTVSSQSIRSRYDVQGSVALAALFKRQYWKRLWVSNASSSNTQNLLTTELDVGGSGSIFSFQKDGVLWR
jgi:hypothetical protein